MVHIMPDSIGARSFRAFAIGARQLVVQEAAEMILSSLVRVLWLTLIDDGGQIVAGRSGDNDLAGACVDMSLCLCLAGIEAGALQHNVNAQLAPGQISSVRHLVDDDLLAVDNDVVVFAFALMEINGVALRNVVALRGVVLQQMREHLGGSQVVDGDNLVAFSAEHLTECQTADTAKTIDRNFNRHE